MQENMQDKNLTPSIKYDFSSEDGDPGYIMKIIGL